MFCAKFVNNWPTDSAEESLSMLSMHLNFIIAQVSTNGKAVFFFKANVRTVEKRIFFAESNEELKEYLSYDNMI